MSRIKCKCGAVLSNCSCPSRWVGWLYSDEERDTYFETYPAEVFDVSREVWECAQCGRLAISTKQPDMSVIWYSPDDGAVANLFGFEDLG